MAISFVFPGQGSQVVGMGKDFFENFKTAREVMEEAEEALEENFASIMFEGPLDTLTLTHNAQPALLITSMMMVRVLEAELKQPLHQLSRYMAGHSLGEYTAYTASGYFNLTDAVKLVRLRGKAMQEAVPVGEGAMAAVLGLSHEDIEAILKDFKSSDHLCVIANDNSPGQIVISGHARAIDEAIRLTQEKGAKRSLKLPVSAPFHSPLMQPAAHIMNEALHQTKITPTDSFIISNVKADIIHNEKEIVPSLVEQVTGRVRWCESILQLEKNDIHTTLEIGSGKVLTGLIKRISSNLNTFNLQSVDDLENTLKLLS